VSEAEAMTQENGILPNLPQPEPFDAFANAAKKG
jgi:hypothetical protein